MTSRLFSLKYELSGVWYLMYVEKFTTHISPPPPSPSTRCESGDMSGKHGQLVIASGSDQNRPTFTYIDNNLELGGTYSSKQYIPFTFIISLCLFNPLLQLLVVRLVFTSLSLTVEICLIVRLSKSSAYPKESLSLLSECRTWPTGT